MKKLFTIFLFSLLILSSCKKESSTDPAPTPANKDITLLTTSAVPGEVVYAQANFKPEKETATISIGNKSAPAFALDSNLIIFIMPELPAGTNATITYKEMGITKQVNITVGTYSTITQPELVFNNFLVAMDSTLLNYQAYENSIIIPLDPAYGRLLKYTKDNLIIKYAGLSPADKIQLAYTIAAYKIDPLETKMDSITNPGIFARTNFTEDDAEDEFQKNTNIYLSKTFNNKVRLLSGLAVMLYSTTLGPGGVVSALAGAYVFLDAINRQTHANAESLNKTFNGFAKRVIGVDAEGRTTLLPITLSKDSEKRVTFKGSFRTVVQSDNTNSFFNSFFQGKTLSENVYDIGRRGYDILKTILGGTAPAYPAPNPPLRTTAIIKKIAIQGSKLKLSNVSNPAITVTYTSDALALKIKASSTTITTETPFTMDLTYLNLNTGTTITDRIDAIYKPFGYKLGYLDGTPVPNQELKFDNGDGKFFILLNENGSAATGIDYNKISVSGNTNANVNIDITPIAGPAGSFLLSFRTNQASEQRTSFDLLYDLKKVQNMSVAVISCDPSAPTPPVINAVNLECLGAGNGRITINVSFTAPGSGILMGSGSGSCDPALTCYPVRLYFLSAGATDWSIASNGYSANLKSGTVNNGVVQINLSGPGDCLPGKSARESLTAYYGTHRWKVELMNKCNQRSASVEF